VGADAVVRCPDAVGAHVASLEDNPWFDAVVVPADAPPPADDPGLPSCVWTFADHGQGRVEDASIATPYTGIALEDAPRPSAGRDPVDVVAPPLDVVAAVNDRAHGSGPAFGPLAARLRDDRVRTHGLEVDGRLVCVAMTRRPGDDLGIHFVATDADHRRTGLATLLPTEVMDLARADGSSTATLQASPDGMPVSVRMGCRQVGLLHGLIRPKGHADSPP